MFSGTHSLNGQFWRALFVACVLTATYPLASASGQATYDFSFGAASGQHVVVGHNLYLKLQIALTTGTPQSLSFQATGLPAGVSYSFPDLEATCCGTGTSAYENGPATTTLLLRTSPSTPTGSYTVQVTATSGGVSHSISYPLVVEPVPAAPTAVPITAQTPIPSRAQWESQMNEWGTYHCNATTIMTNGTFEGGVWYYDGERVYYQIADYTGDPKWTACPGYVEAMYRDTYVIPNSGKVPGWRNFTHGLAMDYLHNGDAQSKNAVILLSNNAAFAPDSTSLFYGIGAGASREVAYAINSYVNAEKVGAPARARLAQYVDIALGHLDQWFVSKTYRCSGSTCGPAVQPGTYYIQPFMVGLTSEALIGYYQKTNDPRIFPAVKTAMDWLWANAWVPADRGFWYENSVPDPSQPFPAAPGYPGLNLLIAPAYAWLYQMTGDTKYRDQGDQLFAGGVATANTSQVGAAYFPIGKQFSQNYRWSFDYVTWRTALSGGTPPPPPPDPTPPPPVSIAPVALLKFDELSGTTASDSSGSGNTLALSGGASFAQGKLSNALSVNGIDGAGRATSTTGLNLSQALTIAAFLKPAAFAQGVYAYNTVAVKGDSSAGRGYGMNIRNGVLNFVKLGAGADVTSAVALSTGVFQHVAITWDRATNDVKFYRDGSLVQTINNSSPITAASDSDPLTVGSWLTGGSSFNGLIDDLRIYNRALSASEVSSLADTAPPSVSMTAPAAGSPVGGTVMVSASASDNIGVAGVQLKLDGVNLGAELTTAPYTTSWNTALAVNGPHTLSAVARDAAGNTATAVAISVTVFNDTALPSVSITAPAAGSTVGGTVAVSATATDNVGVAGVQFKLDGVNLGAEDTTNAYSLTWTTTSVPNGTHTLTAVARDAAGNTATSVAISVTVDNAPPLLSNTSSTNISSSAATITWMTSEVADSQVEYGLTTAYGSETALSTSLVTPHSVMLSGLAESTVYHYRVKSRDAAGNLAVSGDLTFTTRDSTLPTVSMTAPDAGITVSGAITVSASASDNVGVVGVQFKLDGANLGAEVTAAPYTFAWITTTASSGSHTLTAVARDAAGNTATSTAVNVTVFNDATPPTVSMTAPAAGVTVAGTMSVSASATDNVGVVGVQFKLDGVTLGAEVTAAPYAASWTTTTALDGSHTLTAVARDAAGNTATSTAVSVTVDNTPPTVSISAPQPGDTVSSTVIVRTVNAHFKQFGVVGVQFKLDGVNLGAEVTASPWTVSWNTTLVANGSHTLTAVARDAAGNTATAVAISVTAFNDTAPPSVSMTAPAAGSPVGGTVTVSATATDNVGVVGVQFKLDGVNLGAEDTTNAYSLSWTTTSVPNGTHTLTAVARDAAGNTATAVAISVTVDNAPPLLSSASSANISSSAATITWMTSEAADSQVEYGLTTAYGSETALSTSLVTSHSVMLSGLAESTVYHYRVKSRDAAGNLAVSGDFTFTTRDSTLPTVSMTAPAAGATVAGTVTVTASATDNVGVVGVQFKLDGVNLGAEDTTNAYSLSWATTSVPNGTHTLTAVARDAAGNTATAVAISVTVDNAPPLLSSASSTDIFSSAATITWMTSEAADSQVEYGLTTAYGSETALSTSLVASHSVALSGLAESTVYHYRVKSRDAAGNLAVSGDLTFTTRDSTLPTVSMIAPAAAATVTGTVTVTASATDNVGVVGVQFKLDGANLGAEDTTNAYSLSWATTSVPNGTHTLTAVARDAAGNSATAAGISVTVDNDTTPPTVSMTAPAAGSTAGGTVTVSASATDNVGVVGLQFKLDGASLGAELTSAPFSLSWSTASATNGAHTVTALARDAAGNTATAVAVSMIVFNDTVPPTVSMVAPGAGSNVAGTVTVSASATDNAGVVGIQFKLDGANLGAELTAAPYFLSWSTTMATNGAHALTAVARDAAGNVTTSSGVSITVANLTLSILAPLNGATLTDLTKVKVQAASDIGLSSVLVFTDSTLIGTLRCASNPCLSLASTVDWTTSGLAAGPHYLYAVATDTLGNTSSSALIPVIK